MKYYYGEKLVKKSKVMNYKYTIINADGTYPHGAYTTFDNAVNHLKIVARMRANDLNIPFEEAFKFICENLKIAEFTRIEN